MLHEENAAATGSLTPEFFFRDNILMYVHDRSRNKCIKCTHLSFVSPHHISVVSRGSHIHTMCRVEFIELEGGETEKMEDPVLHELELVNSVISVLERELTKIDESDWLTLSEHQTAEIHNILEKLFLKTDKVWEETENKIHEILDDTSTSIREEIMISGNIL